MDRTTAPKLTKDQSGLLKYWVDKCTSDHLPLRREVSPAELVFCLPSISIIERRVCGTDVFRLSASNLRDILGQECRGQLVAEVCGQSTAWYDGINHAIKSKAPVIGCTPAGHLLTHHWMRLPLEPTENGRQPLLCYDKVVRETQGSAPTREAMYATANAFTENRVLERDFA